MVRATAQRGEARLSSITRQIDAHIANTCLVENFDRLPKIAADQFGGIQLSASVEYVAASVDKRFFVAPVACTVQKVTLCVTAAGSDGGAVTAMIEKVPSGTAIGSGTDVLASALNLKSTANTNAAGTLHGTAGNLALAAGDALAVDFTGTLTAATGVITVVLSVDPANENFMVAGTNATSASVTKAAGGGIVLTTAGADNDQVILQANTLAGMLRDINLNTADEVGVGVCIETDASIANVLIYFGLKLTSALDETTDANQVFIGFDTDDSDTYWQGNYSIAGTDTEVDGASVTDLDAMAVSTRYFLEIKIGSDRKARLYVNGVLLTETSALTDDIDLNLYIGLQALEAAAKSITVRPGLAVTKSHND
jgi:hypothetical protein